MPGTRRCCQGYEGTSLMSTATPARRPTLLFVVTEDWYFCSHRLAMASAAGRAGYDVALVTRVARHGERIRQAGIRLIPFEFARGRINPLIGVRTIARLAAVYRRERPDIVHHVALEPVLYGSVAARLSGVTSVVNALTGFGWLFTSHSLTARLLKPLIRASLRRLLRPTWVIVQNREDAALVRSWGVSRLHQIRGAGVDCALFQPGDRSAGVPLVILPARMLRDKGVLEFVAAARSIRQAGLDARFALVGSSDPDNRNAIPVAQLEAWRHEGVVEWWGHRDDMTVVYQQADIVCVPSYREGLPKSLIEAMAAGCPVVAADVPGCREAVRHEHNGLLVPAREAEPLARALTRLLCDPVERRAMGRAGRQEAMAGFSQGQVIAETLRLYAEVRR